MRTIIKHAIAQFFLECKFKEENIEVTTRKHIHLKCNGELLAFKHSFGTFFVCNIDGERNFEVLDLLNSLPNVLVTCDEKNNWTLNGEVWDGKWKEIF